MSEIITLGPVGLNPLGEYNSETEYEKLDVVLYQGSSYVALQTVQGQAPTNTEYWQKLVTGGMDIIDNLESEDTQKALSAKQGKVLNDNFENSLESNYYDEITYAQIRRYNTDCYVAIIPKFDNKGSLIEVYVDKDDNKSPNQYADANETTITTNAGLTYQNSSNVWKQGIVIGNGVVLNQAPSDITYQNYNTYIGFDEQRNILEYQANITTPESMLNDGVKNAYLVFYRYMNNGVLEEHLDAGNWAVESPRMDIGIKSNGDLVILACDGRTANNKGLLNTEALTIMQEYNCVRAWRCDGGGSTSLNLKGNKINRNIDDNATTDRKITVTLNVKKEIVNQENAKTYNEINKQKQLLNKQIRTDLLEIFNNYEHKRSRMYYVVNDNTRNNIVTANTYQLAKFNGKYRHGDDILPFRDENNNVVGFTLQKSGLCRIVVVANFESQGSGDKVIKITKGDNDETEWFQDIQISENSTIYKQMICETIINNRADSPLPIKIWIRSSHAGDRFIRMTAYAETLGVAES